MESAFLLVAAALSYELFESFHLGLDVIGLDVEVHPLFLMSGSKLAIGIGVDYIQRKLTSGRGASPGSWRGVRSGLVKWCLSSSVTRR